MLRRIASLMAVAFGLVNLALAAFAQHANLAGQPFDVQSRPLYELRLREIEPRTPGRDRRAVFVGDSLVYGAHLAKSDPEHWAERTLPAAFARWGRTHGFGELRSVNLGINGVLYSDASCAVRDALSREPDWLFVNLSPRPFAAEFATAGAPSERPFVCAPGSALASRLRRVVPVWGLRDALQFAWLGTTPRAFVREWADGMVRDPFDAEDEDLLADVALRMKAAQRLDSIDVRADHPQAARLSELLRQLEGARRTRVVAFYLGENIDYLAGQLDLAHYEAQHAAFVAHVRAALVKTPFVVLPREAFGDFYVDHIHLSAEGYAQLAQRLGEEVGSHD